MQESTKLSDKPSIAFLGDYLPRQCGIATFTHDLCESVAIQAGDGSDVFAVAMNDIPEGYPYPDRVRFEVRQASQPDYRLAAEFLNIRQVSAVCVQHEYGIYGGTCGSHLLGMLRRIRRPMVATLHTVLTQPTHQQQTILEEIARVVERLVVMTDVGHGILQERYKVPPEKIVMIPHGIPDVPFVDPNFFKDQFGVEGRTMMLTFGLLSPGKGLEYAIDALPAVIRKHPELVYVILGATHPHIRRESGEEYRNSLMRRVEKLGLNDHVMFVNRFVSTEELCEYLGAADLYVTPYLNEAQITSGTLAYAMGTGNAVISTPYWYAVEMLSDGRGRLVPFADAEAIAGQILHLLDHDTERHAIRKRAYNYCRQMTWKRVAQDYLDLFAEAREAWIENRHRVVSRPTDTRPQKLDDLPETDLRHLRVLTDDTGVIQCCRYSTPDRVHGYATDDVARALVVSVMHYDQTHDESVLGMMQTYLSFLAHAQDPATGRFRSYMAYDRSWDEVGTSEDCHARVLWALGTAVAMCPYETQIALATQLFTDALATVERFVSPRAWGLTIIGMHAYLRRFGGDSEVRRFRSLLSEKLFALWRDNADDEWPWFEDVVTYANGLLPHALLMSGKWMHRDDMISAGERALAWLVDVQTDDDGHLSLVGTNGWYPRGGRKASYIQEPAEVQAIIDACIEAYRVTQQPRWIECARRGLNWFLGDNDLRTPLYDFTTGGCRDGLREDRVNENQGAESTLAWLLSLLLMHDLQMEQTLGEPTADKETGHRPVRRPIRPTGPVLEMHKRDHGSSNRTDQ